MGVDIAEQSIVLITEPNETEKNYVIHSIREDDSKLILERAVASTRPSEVLLSRYLFQALPPYLSVPENEIHIIISTKSGTEKADSIFETVLKPLLCVIGITSPLVHAVEKTTSHESIRAYAYNTLRIGANLGKRQTVLLLSGDGGVVDLINGVLETETSSSFVRPNVALFPLGTGNALFHSIYRGVESAVDAQTLAQYLTLAVRSFLNGSLVPLPIFRADFSPGARVLSDEGRAAAPLSNQRLYGAVVASYGFHATLVADSDTAEYRKYGDKRFGMVAKELIDNPHAYKAKVTTYKDDKTNGINLGGDEHAYALVTLVSNLEKTFTISPFSKPLDGSLRVVHFEPGKNIMEIMGAAYDNGKHIAGDKQLVNYEEIECINIEFLEDDEGGQWRRVCIDGLIVRIEKGGWIRVTKVPGTAGAVDVVAPHGVGGRASN